MLRNATRRVLSTAAAYKPVEPSANKRVPSSDVHFEQPTAARPHLSLFPTPKVFTPTFELTRRLGTFFSQGVYQLFYEKAYNLERFVHAANEGASVIGECIANEEWSRMNVIASTELVEDCKTARTRCTAEQLDMLRFHPHDVILSFLHSSLISVRRYKTEDDRGIIVSIYFTIVSFIRKNDSVPDQATLSQLLNKYKEDVMVSNITFARNVSPLSQWKATSVNFFSLDEANHRQY